MSRIMSNNSSKCRHSRDFSIARIDLAMLIILIIITGL